jgi:hypothetical protein
LNFYLEYLKLIIQLEFCKRKLWIFKKYLSNEIILHCLRIMNYSFLKHTSDKTYSSGRKHNIESQWTRAVSETKE